MRWVALVFGCAVVGLACSESGKSPDDDGMAGASSMECETQLVRDWCAVRTSTPCPADETTLDDCIAVVSLNRCGPFYECVAEYDALLECMTGGSRVCVDDRSELADADCRAEGTALTDCMGYNWLCRGTGDEGQCDCGRASSAGSPDDASCPPPPTTGCCWERLDGNACECSPDPEVCEAYAAVSNPVESCPPP